MNEIAIFFTSLYYNLTSVFRIRKRIWWQNQAFLFYDWRQFVSSKEQEVYWMSIPERNRKILMEYMLGVAWGAFNERIVCQMVDMYTKIAEQHPSNKKE
jgi:hypothetical protein